MNKKLIKVSNALLLTEFKHIFRVMKLTSLFGVLCVSSAFAINVNSQSLRVNIHANQKQAKEVIKQIEEQTDYLFVYNHDKVNLNNTVTIQANNETVAEVLNQMFAGTDIIYAMQGNNILLMQKDAVVQQSGKVVTGTIVDPSGMPVIGANVMVKGTTNGTITDMDGKFSLEVEEGATLQISYIGYANQEIKVGNQKTLSIVLKEDAEALDELVVVGYMSQKKISLTGAVSSMTITDELKNVPSTSPADILAGQLSGVAVSTADAVPGNQSTISIRAKTSWNNQDVLYIIDDIISTATDFSNLTANEIENITVLKDAASAAIYGSRAAGGVIVVKTKLGQYGEKIKINYSFNTGFSKRGKNAELTNAAQTAEMYMRINAPSDPIGWAWTSEEIEWIKNINNGWGYDLVEAVWQDPKISTHNIDISGGSDKVRFFAGGSFTKQNGFLQNLWYKKNNYRFNIAAKVTKDLEIFGSISLQHTKRSLVTGSSAGDIYGVYQWLLGWQPDDPIWTENGLPIDPGWNASVAAQVRGDAGYIHDYYLKPILNIKAIYQIPYLKGLSLSASFSKSYDNNRNKTYQKKYKMYVTKKDGIHKVSVKDADITGITMSSQIPNDYLEETSLWGDSWQYNLQLIYDRIFKGDHRLKATLVFEKQEANNGGMFAGIQKFPVYNTDNWWAASSDRVDSYVSNDKSLTDQIVGRQSWIGQISYGFKEKYLLNASYRYDGSMNFSPEHRWGFFPSGSIGWVISNEDFFCINNINLLKLRCSVGLTGNDAIGGWQWQQSYKSGNSSYFGSNNSVNQGITYGVLPNKNLTWEKSLMYNWGIDMSFFNNFTLNSEYYITKTYDILGVRSLAVPPTFSLELPAENYGEIQARGFELSLGYSNMFGDFNFKTGFVASYSNAKYIKFDDDKVTYDFQKKVGRSLTAVYGLKHDRIIRTQSDLDNYKSEYPNYTCFGIPLELGQLVYKDLGGPDGKPDGLIDDYDQVLLKKNNNPVLLGFSLGGEWKGFSLNAVFNGSFGQERFMSDLYTGQEWDRMWIDSYYQGWTPENPNAQYPKRLSHLNWNKTYALRNTDFWLAKCNFLRLKNFNFSYTIPVELYKRLGIERAQIYFTGSNMFIISSFNKKYYDPEISHGKSFPIMKSYNFGISLTL